MILDSVEFTVNTNNHRGLLSLRSLRDPTEGPVLSRTLSVEEQREHNPGESLTGLQML